MNISDKEQNLCKINLWRYRKNVIIVVLGGHTEINNVPVGDYWRVGDLAQNQSYQIMQSWGVQGLSIYLMYSWRIFTVSVSGYLRFYLKHYI